MKIILIVGLPASGKTFLGRKLALEQNLKLIDDPTYLSEIVSHENGLVICDPKLCRQIDRNCAKDFLKSKFPNAEIEWIFFENDYKACLKNSHLRKEQGDNRSVDRFIWYLSTVYSPEGSCQIPVWKDKS